MPKKGLLGRLLSSWLYLLAIATLLLESYGNMNRIYDLTGINGERIAIWLLIALTVLRFSKKFLLPKKLRLFNLVLVLPISLLLTLTLIFTEQLTFPNFVYSRFGLNIQKISVITFFSVLIHLLTISKAWWKENYQKAILLSAPTILLVFLVIRTWPYGVFDVFVKEDGLVEFLQFFLLLFAAGFAFNIGKRLIKKRKKRYAQAFYLLAIALFLIAGEEISWGQRLLSTDTPAWLLENNLQQETNAHNLIDFSLTRFIYILISLYGIFSTNLYHSLISKPKTIIEKLFLIPTFVRSHFIIGLIFYIYTGVYLKHGLSSWGEVIELVLYFAVTAVIIQKYFLVKTIKNKQLTSPHHGH